MENMKCDVETKKNPKTKPNKKKPAHVSRIRLMTSFVWISPTSAIKATLLPHSQRCPLFPFPALLGGLGARGWEWGLGLGSGIWGRCHCRNIEI